MKAPHRSPAYTYMHHSAPMEYGGGHHGAHGGHYSRKHSYSEKGYPDLTSQASDDVPVFAASSLRYGDRISAKPTSANVGGPTPTVVKPIHRHRVNRNRGGNASARQPIPDYYTSTPTTTTPPPPPPQSQPASHVVEDYSYQTPYEPDVGKHQMDSVNIAMIPIKSSEFTEITENNNSNKQSENDGSLPQNLINYIRQVQDQASQSQSNGGYVRDDDGRQSDSNGDESSNNNDKDNSKSNNMNTNVLTVLSGSEPSISPMLVKLPPLSSIAIEHETNQVNRPLQTQWQINRPTNTIVSNMSPPHQTNEYVYRPPELKVIRTRYNPKAMAEQNRLIQAQTKPNIPSIPQSVSNSFGLTSINSPISSSGPSVTNVSTKPHHTQFIYSVTHQATPFGGDTFPSYQSIGGRYPNSDNFGLNAFHQSQQQQMSKPNYRTSPLLPSASSQTNKWLKPNEKIKSSKFFNNLGNRFSQLF